MWFSVISGCFFGEQARPSPGSRPTPRWAVGLGADADAPTPRAHIYLLSHPQGLGLRVSLRSLSTPTQGARSRSLALGYCTFAPPSGAYEFRA